MGDIHKMILALREAIKEELTMREDVSDASEALSEALSAFVQCDDIEQVPTLVKMLSDQQALMHHAAMLGLLAIGPDALDELDKGLCDPDAEHLVVDRVAQVMFFMSTPWAFERIGEVLGYPRAWSLMGQWIDFGPHVQYEADTGASVILTLRPQIERDTLDIARGLLAHDANTAIDYGILSVLAGFAPDSGALSIIQTVLTRWMDATNGAALVERGLWSLTRWPAEDVVPTMMQFLDSNHHKIASLTLSQMGPVCIPEISSVIDAWRTSAQKTSRRADAVRALIRMDNASATQVLLNLFDESDILIRHMAWYTLASRGLAVDLLMDKAQHGDELDQPEALEALSRCPQEEAYTFLVQEHARMKARGNAFEAAELMMLANHWKHEFEQKEH